MFNKIQNFDQTNSLREIWIGDVYPEHFYSHYDQKTQDIFGKITEITKHDFSILEKTLQNLGVNVVRPRFNSSIDLYLNNRDILIKPPVAPCDFALALDDTLYITPQYHSGIEPYQHAIDQYLKNNQKVKILDRSQDTMCWLNFPSVVRAGRDIFIDYDLANQEATKNTYAIAEALAQTHRVHLSTTGDHSDGVFCPLSPRNIITTHYRSNYKKSFPGWNVYHLDKPAKNVHCLKWWVPGNDYADYNTEILKVASDWLGNPHESVFEINLIVVDQHNIICSPQKDSVLRHFESLGITPHIVDFRACYFWDAGLHCVSSDVWRDGDTNDHWPGRGSNGIYQITEW